MATRGISTNLTFAFMSTNAVLINKKGRGIFAILRPFPVGRYFDFYTALSQTPFGFPLAHFLLLIKI